MVAFVVAVKNNVEECPFPYPMERKYKGKTLFYKTLYSHTRYLIKNNIGEMTFTFVQKYTTTMVAWLIQEG